MLAVSRPASSVCALDSLPVNPFQILLVTSMKIHELRELTVEELGKRGRELRQEMLTLRIQKATGQLENKLRHGQLRKEVARIETILTERRIKAEA